MLKALTDSTWGSDKETLLATYQAIGRLILSYSCPVWTPSHEDTIWSRLQRAQNSALGIITGCLKMADVAELHQEARELPVRQHAELISRHFAIACHMSLTCCIKSHCTPATLAPAHTPCLFSIDLHTVRQHLVIVHFILLLLLSGTLFQMMSGVPHHSHYLSLV